MNYNLSMNSSRIIASMPKTIPAGMSGVYEAGWNDGFDAAWNGSTLFKPYDTYAYKAGCKAGFKAGRSDAHHYFYKPKKDIFEDGKIEGYCDAYNNHPVKTFDSSGPFANHPKWLEGYRVGYLECGEDYEKDTGN